MIYPNHTLWGHFYNMKTRCVIIIIPKTGSTTIRNTLVKHSDFKLKNTYRHSNGDITYCTIRDPFERYLSGVHMFAKLEKLKGGRTPKELIDMLLNKEFAHWSRNSRVCETIKYKITLCDALIKTKNRIIFDEHTVPQYILTAPYRNIQYVKMQDISSHEILGPLVGNERQNASTKEEITYRIDMGNELLKRKNWYDEWLSVYERDQIIYDMEVKL